MQKYNHLKKKNEESSKQSVEEPTHDVVVMSEDSSQNVENKVAHFPTEGTEHPPPRLDRDIILSAIPKLYKGKTNSLLNHLPSSITWNNRGEAIIDGSTIEGSHMSDLLRDTQRHYKNIVPTGRDQFWKALKDSNIPRSLVGNEHFFSNGSVVKHDVKRLKKVKKAKVKPFAKWITLWV